jgi:hypothetical protein
VKITEIGFEEEKMQAVNNECYKDLPVVFFNSETRKVHKGFINHLGIIHQNQEKVSCQNIDQLFIFPVKVNNNHSFLSITRREFGINYSLGSNFFYDFVDPFDFSRNHFENKLEKILVDNEGLYDHSRLIDFNQSKMSFGDVIKSQSFKTGLEYLFLVPLLTILTNLFLFCLYSCCKKLRVRNSMNHRYLTRMRMYKDN